SWVFTDEAANATLNSALSVENILVDNNSITRTRNDGFRIGTGWGKTSTYTGKRSDGSTFSRSYTGGVVGLLGLTNNDLASVGGQAIAINNRPNANANVMCSANSDDGKPASNSLCSGAKPVIAPACTAS